MTRVLLFVSSSMLVASFALAGEPLHSEGARQARAADVDAAPLVGASPVVSDAAKSAANDTARRAEKTLRKSFLAALDKKEKARSKFSRVRMPPAERQVRILDEVPVADARGKTFVAFAVDERYSFGDDEEEWQRDQIVGCLYVDTDAIYVKRGDDTWRPSSFLLGKKAKAAPEGVCAPATTAKGEQVALSANAARQAGLR